MLLGEVFLLLLYLREFIFCMLENAPAGALGLASVWLDNQTLFSKSLNTFYSFCQA